MSESYRPVPRLIDQGPRFLLQVTLWDPNGGDPAELRLHAGNDGDTRLVGRWKAVHGCWTVNDLQDVITALHQSLLTAVILTSGVQLALPPDV
jgi:hypothetical protein